MPGIDPAFLWSGAVLGAVGVVVAALRNVPQVAWDAFVRAFTVSIETRDQQVVKWVGIALIERFGLPAQHTSAVLKRRRDAVEVTLEPARGKHLLRRGGRFVLVDRGKEEPGKSGETHYMAGLETVRLRGFGRREAWLRSMLDEAVTYGRQRFQDFSPVKVSTPYGDWVDLDVGEPRSLASVILPGRQKEEACEAIRLFLSRPDWYAEKGVPWRFGLGLFGEPGSGKSSLARAICGEFGLGLYIVDLSDKNLTDGALLRALGTVGPRSMVLLDDLDATLLPNRDGTPGGVTLAGLLAVMDGPGAGEGRVLAICSNHPEKLDRAILREGRIDHRIDLGPATREQATNLYRLWRPEENGAAEIFGAENAGKAMAELQGMLLRGERAGSSNAST